MSARTAATVINALLLAKRCYACGDVTQRGMHRHGRILEYHACAHFIHVGADIAQFSPTAFGSEPRIRKPSRRLPLRSRHDLS